WRDREAELKDAKSALDLQRDALAKERAAIDREVDEKLSAAQKQLKSEALAEARAAVSSELQSAQADLVDTKSKLQQALDTELQLDEILPVPKGVHGGDVVHVVRDGTGSDCGIILWEFKNTKNWMKDWLPKLRDNQRTAKAHLAILVSDELPKIISTFGYVEEV